LAEYTGVLIILALAVLLTSGLMWLHLRLGPRRELDAKLDPFECGEEPLDSPRRRYAVKFFLVALLFVIFDVEAVFFYPWGAVFRELGLPGLIAMGIFAVPLVVALAYEWLKGALEW
jgi:NADH-quinone oxidoreductase subunit A